jgi:polyisoprenoid-binding protein YceI
MNRIAVACWLSVVVAWAPPERVRASREDSAKTFRIVPGLSQASYAVDEVFLNENNRLFTAVGVTTAVSGTIVVDSTRLADSRIDEIVVDLRELKSDSDRRDRALREKYLDTGRFPFARLTRGVFAGLPATVTPGRAFTYSITSDLTVHGTTRRTRWRGEASLVGDTLRGVARADVTMSDFGIEVPRLLSLRSADAVKLEIRVVAVATLTTPVP